MCYLPLGGTHAKLRAPSLYPDLSLECYVRAQHFKMECATDARYLYDLLRKILHAPIYLDSSTLSDLRSLFVEGIHQSDTVPP